MIGNIHNESDFQELFQSNVVPCGGPKKSPRTSSIVQIIFSFGSLRSARVF